jgi:type I site-specific restriction-modification system R (restriction) subunit
MTPPTGYTEDAMVERPAISLLADLGWETVNAYHEFDHGASSLGRETRAEAILTARLRKALQRLNPDAPIDAISQAIEELARDRSRMSMTAANRELYHLLKNGVRVPDPDGDGDGETVEAVRVMDWDNPTHNDFLLCSQFWITGDMHTRRADLVGFVNGLPLVLFELNAGSLNADEFFQQLMTFAKSLSEEEKRGVSKQLNEEELALFDLLTKPQIELSDSDREKVKVTARDLLNTLKAGKLVLDWRKRQQARADVRITIEKMLDMGLPRAYTPELFDQKTSAVFQHVYDAYYGAGHSVCAMA